MTALSYFFLAVGIAFVLVSSLVLRVAVTPDIAPRLADWGTAGRPFHNCTPSLPPPDFKHCYDAVLTSGIH